ncbi:MAG: TraB/GumN family protein [Lentisphaeraceae bacterium]|nr:TraB/GumN family protein [Lentisphaeraceae bacterium]
MIRLILLAFLLAFNGLYASTTVKEKKASATTSKNFLWEVQGGKTKIFLMGSIHAADKNFYPLNSAALKAFSQCKQLGLEADVFSPQKMMKMQQLIMATAMYTGDKDLSSEFTPTEIASIGKLMTQAGLPKAAWMKMKPWILFMTSQQVAMMQAGLNPLLGLDHHFHSKAKKTGKKVIELESIEAQLKLFQNLPDTNKMLIKHAEDPKAGLNELKTLLKAVKNGDTKVLLEVLAKMKKETPGAYKSMLVDRNHGMANKIDTWAKNNKSTFIVVGAAHLPGTEGIVALLKAKGYKLKRL